MIYPDKIKDFLKANEVYLGEAAGEFSKDATGSAKGEAKAISEVGALTGNSKLHVLYSRQSETSCERRKKAQALKSDLESGLQLWSKQASHILSNFDAF